jgi:hypothetical protein
MPVTNLNELCLGRSAAEPRTFFVPLSEKHSFSAHRAAKPQETVESKLFDNKITAAIS